jgi:membrane fusion protein, multidrug efflux system
MASSVTRRFETSHRPARAEQQDLRAPATELHTIEQDHHARTGTPLEIPEPDAGPPGSSRPRPVTRRRGWGVLLGVAALLLGATLVFEGIPSEEPSQGPAKPQAATAPIPVTVTEVSTRDVPIYFEGLGTVQASNTIAIHSQVDGKLQSVNFVEGQQVRKGDTLAVIDQRPFQAALDQAKARRAEDEAQLVSDQKDLARFKDLVGKGAGTQQAVDQQQAKVDNLKATIEADQAGIESADTQLSFATITAPIDGRIGFRQVDAGNIVHAGDQTPITVLTAIKPAWVILTLPQRDLTPVRDALAKGNVPAVAYDQDDAHELAKGTLLLIDNQIDQTTSTIRLKASFPNEAETLWPGEFVRVHLLVNTLKDAATIPAAALQRSTTGVFAWVINDDSTAENRPVVVGASTNDIVVVDKGLKPGERVVVSGQYRLRPGVKVDPGSSTTPVAQRLAP